MTIAEDLESRLEARVSRDWMWFRHAQNLRHRVFMAESEFSAALPVSSLDDSVDRLCEHLVVRDLDDDVVVGACRILAPDDARRAGGYHSEHAFDMDLLGVLRDRMVEVGRTCIHPEYRGDCVMRSLFSALARYLIDNGYDYVIGSAELDVSDGGHHAASIHRAAWERSASPEDYRVYPRRRLPLEILCGTRAVSPPPHLRGYLDAGAWVSGEPAIDEGRECALLPFLLPLARMRDRYARHFLARAA